MVSNFWHNLVPRPNPQKKERVWYTSSAFWGLFLNIDMPIRFTQCGLHVIIMWHRAIATFAARERHWCVAMPKRCIVMMITTCCILCNLKSTQRVPDPLLFLGGWVWEQNYLWHVDKGGRNCWIPWYFNYSPLITNLELLSTTTSNFNVVFYLSTIGCAHSFRLLYLICLLHEEDVSTCSGQHQIFYSSITPHTWWQAIHFNSIHEQF